MVQEVAVDRNLRAIDLQRGDAKPVGIDMVGRLPGCPLAKKHDVGHDGGAFPLERIGRQPDRPDEVGLRGEVFADGGVLLVEREMRRDQCQDAAGLEGVDGFGEEVIMQGELLALIVELYVGERHVADHRVDAVLRQLRVAEILDADVLVGVKRLGDPPGDGIHFHADEAHARRCPGP